MKGHMILALLLTILSLSLGYRGVKNSFRIPTSRNLFGSPPENKPPAKKEDKGGLFGGYRTKTPQHHFSLFNCYIYMIKQEWET
jgi:hypothetical protein